MVCQGYKCPDHIDPKFLDPKYALENSEQNQEEEVSDKITSLKKLLDVKKRHRGGYTDEATKKMLLYEDLDMIDFLNSEDPYPMLTSMNKVSFVFIIFTFLTLWAVLQFIMDKEATLILEEHANKLKPPKDLPFMIGDIKNCGRRDMQHLLRLRHKYKILMHTIDQAAKDAARPAKEEKVLTEAEEEAELDKELDKQLAHLDREKKRQAKKDHEEQKKSDLRKKMSVIASSAIENDEDLVIKGDTRRMMVKMLNDESDKESSVDEDAFEKDESSSAAESESEEEKEEEDEESMDSEAERINEMADQYEENL